MKSFFKSRYGWWILAGAVLTQYTATSMGQMVSGVMLEPLVDELGLQVWQFAASVSIAMVIGGVMAIFVGPQVDKIGPKRLMISGALICSAGLIGLAWQSSFWLFVLFQTVSRSFGLPLFGPLVVNATLTKWFIARRGWALAIGSAGVSLAGLITPIMMTTIVDSQGWRFGYLTLAGIVATIILPIAFVMRRQPEDVGLFPDGRQEAIPEGDTENKIAIAQARDDQQTYTRPESIRTSGFWLLTLGYGLNAAALGSVLMYAIPFAGAAGFSRGIAATGLGINGLGNLSSKAVWGWGLQRFDPRRLAGVAFCTSATGVFIMLLGDLTHETIILMIGFYLYGFGFGGTIPISEFLWARYFGRRHIGAIRGISRPMTLLFSAGGPIATGLWFDTIGSYQGAFFTLACLYLLGAITINVSKAPPPNQPNT